jgi:hypothetical protein
MDISRRPHRLVGDEYRVYRFAWRMFDTHIYVYIDSITLDHSTVYRLTVGIDGAQSILPTLLGDLQCCRLSSRNRSAAFDIRPLSLRLQG